MHLMTMICINLLIFTKSYFLELYYSFIILIKNFNLYLSNEILDQSLKHILLTK